MWLYYIKEKLYASRICLLVVRQVIMNSKEGLLVLCYGVLFSLVHVAALEEGDGQMGRGLDAKGLLTSLASNFMNRGYVTSDSGSSQVISLNVTNLLVLVLLKALIFAAGSLGAGTWKGGYARSLDGEEKFLTDEEILMYLSYLTGSPGCLQNIACLQPQQAKKYVTAGDMLLKLTKMFSIDTDLKYEYVIQGIDQAANTGLSGGNCQRFECDNNKL